MTRFNKILIGLVITSFLKAASSPVLDYAVKEYFSTEAFDAKIFYGTIIGLILVLPKAIFGYWLYFAAKDENQKKWIWCAIGISWGIYGVLIFYPYMILREIRSRKELNLALGYDGAKQ